MTAFVTDSVGRICQECGQEHKRDGRFCGIPCKSRFNNRRQTRGAELYDAAMTARKTGDAGAQEYVDRLLDIWLSDDRKSGRASFRHVVPGGKAGDARSNTKARRPQVDVYKIRAGR